MPLARYLLDTNIISELARNPSGPVARRIALVGADSIATSVIVASEIRFGVLKRGSPRLTQRLGIILGQIEILSFDSDAIEHYADIRLRLERSGTPIGPNDLLIAAHARTLGMVVVTDNDREFGRVADLEVENWLTRDTGQD